MKKAVATERKRQQEVEEEHISRRTSKRRRKEAEESDIEEAASGGRKEEGQWEEGLDIVAIATKTKQKRSKGLSKSMVAVRKASDPAAKIVENPLARTSNIGAVPRITVCTPFKPQVAELTTLIYLLIYLYCSAESQDWNLQPRPIIRKSRCQQGAGNEHM